MLFRAKQVSNALAPLQPFVLRLRDGFLIGLGMDPEKGSPCVECSERWLVQRRVFAERVPVADLTLRRDLLDQLIAENSAHVFYEISSDGSFTRMDCLVFPHPRCRCSKSEFVAPPELSKKTNFAFSPLHQIKCARYGTPNGNVWLTSAAGTASRIDKTIRVYGAGRERESARMKTVEEWLKRSAFEDFCAGVAQGGQFGAENFRTGAIEAPFNRSELNYQFEGLGAGETRESAILDGLTNLAKTRTLRKYASSLKSPMLVVGSNNWVRGRVPFSLIQQYDLHLLFYPNSTPTWVVGVAAMSRLKTNEAPIFVFGAGGNILTALDSALLKMLEHCRPVEWSDDEPGETTEREVSPRMAKLNTWWTHWIYRCPKISLKDVLHLEPYKPCLETWRQYFSDGQEKLSIIPINSPLLPEKLRYLVKVNGPEAQSNQKLNGIGVWSSFRPGV